MGKPDHTGLIQCSYCGTTITYNPPVEKTERKNVERFLEICKAALDGKNYEETLQYTNKILEIDPENVDAWINKAIATFWLTTEAKNRYDEAMKYLKKAENNALQSERIAQVKDELLRKQALWMINLGNEKIKQGDEIYISTLNRYTPEALDTISNLLEAQNNRLGCYIEARDYFLLAASYLPNDITILQNFEYLVKKEKKFLQDSDVNRRIHHLQILRAKPECEYKLPKLKQELQQTQQDLAALKKRKSIFDAFKIDAAEDKVKKIKEEITRCEGIIAYKI